MAFGTAEQFSFSGLASEDEQEVVIVASQILFVITATSPSSLL
jgi:hypothetical protein